MHNMNKNIENQMDQNLPDWFSLIQKSEDNYKEIYKTYATKRKWVFNWSAFLFGPIWAMYRKMPKLALIMFCLQVFTLLLEVTLTLCSKLYGANFSSIIGILNKSPYFLGAGFGFYANYTLFQSMEKKYKAGYRASFYKPTSKILAVTATLFAPLLSIVLFFAFSIAISILFKIFGFHLFLVLLLGVVLLLLAILYGVVMGIYKLYERRQKRDLKNHLESQDHHENNPANGTHDENDDTLTFDKPRNYDV